MEARCRVALIKSRSALVNDLDIKPTIDHLMSKLVITPEQSQTILAEKSDHDKRRDLLNLIPGRGQKAFDVFLEYLEGSQFWLNDVIKENLATITQEELVTIQEESQQLSRGGPTAQELQQALRRNIAQYINNDPSRILEEESTVYIQQTVTVEKIESEKKPEKMPLGNISELLETCNPLGQRVFVYGEAGTGKSSLCRNIAKIWAEGESKLLAQFDYVLPISIRSVRSHSLAEVICKDMKLFPETCKERIQQELELKSVLFLLDSFEELSHETPELNKLLRRELYSNCSVLVTARPGHQLEREENESKPCLRVHLKGLTEEQVKDYMARYPGLQEHVQLQIRTKFGMSFLSRPINIWLVCLLLAQVPSSVGMPDTQTVLLNMIVQRLMLAYSKKKHLSCSNLKPESPYKKRQVSDVTLESPIRNAPTEVKLILKEVGELCFFGLRDKNRVLIIDDGVLSRADVLAMGLFSEGADDNSVTLPHPLFQEYLAALFLSVDRRARLDLLKELREESGGSSHRISLVELLRKKGFENMMRFLVGLSGVPEGLTDLFCLKPFLVVLGSTRSVDFHYEMDLLRECWTEEGKSQIASALLTAPVGDSIASDTSVTSHSHLLLHHFDEEQRKTFLRKFYGYEICSHQLIQVHGRRSSLVDNFVVGMLYLNNCTVRLEGATVEGCQVPLSMLTEMLVAVEDLTLKGCTLCDLTESQFLASLNLTSLSHSLTDTPKHLRQPVVSLHSLRLDEVQGLDLLSPPHCTLPAMRELRVVNCEDVNLGSLRQCFTGLDELLMRSNEHVYNYDGQWSSVHKLHLVHCEDVNLGSLRQCFTGASELELCFTKHVHNADGQWPSVSKLEVSNCDDVNLGSLGQCFTGVSELKLWFTKHVNNYDGQWSSVSKLEVSYCEDVNLGSLRQCFTGLGELRLISNKPVYNYDGHWSSVHQLHLIDCEDRNLGSLRQYFTGVSELKLISNKHVHSYDGQWSSVRKLQFYKTGVKIDLLTLKEMFVQLEELDLYGSHFRIEKAVPDRPTQWQTVKFLKFPLSKLHTDERTLSKEEAREFLTQFCPQAEIINPDYGF